MACIREYTVQDVERMYRWCVRDNRCNLPVSDTVKASLRQVLLSEAAKQAGRYLVDHRCRRVHLALFEEEWQQINACMKKNPFKKG